MVYRKKGPPRKKKKKGRVRRTVENRSREGRLAGINVQDDVCDTLRELLRKGNISWFVTAFILDIIGIDFLVGLVVDGEYRVWDVDVFRGWGSATAVKKDDQQRRHKRKRPRYSPDRADSMPEKSRRLLKAMKKGCVPVEVLQDDWKFLFSSRRRLNARLEGFIDRKNLWNRTEELSAQFDREWAKLFNVSLSEVVENGGVWSHFLLCAGHADLLMRVRVEQEIAERSRLRIEKRLRLGEEQEQPWIEVTLRFFNLLRDASDVDVNVEYLIDQHSRRIAESIESYFSGIKIDGNSVGRELIQKHLSGILERIDRDLEGWRLYDSRIPELLPLFVSI